MTMVSVNLTHTPTIASAPIHRLFTYTTENGNRKEEIFDFVFKNTTYEESNITNSSFPSSGNYPVDSEIPLYIRALSTTLCVVIFCLGLIGNAMVPIVILKTKDMRNSTNIFLVNLSIADLMVLIVNTPTALAEVNRISDMWILGTAMCLAVPFVQQMVVQASVLTILALSFERYYAICKPFKAGYVCTNTRAAVICALVWLFAASFASPLLGIKTIIVAHYDEGIDFPRCVNDGDPFWINMYYFVIITVFFFIPLAILFVIYTIIAKNLIENSTFIAQNSNNTNNSDNVIRYRKQVIRMLGTVVLFFFICLLPREVLRFMILISPNKTLTSLGVEGYYALLNFTRVMVYLHSTINPVLYNLMSSKFRAGFVKLLRINELMRFCRN